MYINAYNKTLLFDSSLKEMNEGELKKEDSAKLEEIFHLLVNSVQPVDRYLA